MYVRIARFEGGDPGQIDEFAAMMREQLAAMRRGETPEGLPAEAAGPLRDHVVRLMDLADRSNGNGAGLVFTEDEAGMRAVDAALNAMSPGEGGGRRVSVDIYEVVLDEPTR